MKYQFSTPYFRYLGYATWLVLLVFAIVFFKERAIFMDGAFQLVEMINEKSFKIYHYRLTNPLTQILAVTAIYLELPLKWVLLGYSVNFILFFAFIYHLIVHYFKNDYLGWLQIFFFTLLVLDSFYFLPPEFYQGMSLMLLFFAILLRYPTFEKKWVFPALLILLIPVIFDHKLIASFFLYLWAFFWLSHPILRTSRKYYTLLTVMFGLVVIHSLFFTGWYDGMKQAEFMTNLHDYFPNYHLIPANQYFWAKCVKFYYFYPIFLMLGILGYLTASLGWLKRFDIKFPFWKLGLLLAGNLGYLFLVQVGGPTVTYRFYAEVNYIGLSVLIMTPILFDFLPKIKYPKLILGAFLVIVLIRLNTIGRNHQTFENRHQWFTEQLKNGEKLNTNRLILLEKDAPMDLVVMSWASPQESLLLSVLENSENPQTLLIANQEKQYMPHLENDSCYLTSFKKMDLDEINDQYFQFNHKKYLFIK